MTLFETNDLPAERDSVAPDGSDVRLLTSLEGGSMAHFQLEPGQTSKAVVHRTVEEVWYVVHGRGEMWREQDGRSEVVELYPGVSLTLPLGTRFQFRATGDEPLAAVGVTIPPWPGEDEAIVVDGFWEPSAFD